MPFDSRFHRLFPNDLAFATAFYDRISVGLGNRFRNCIHDKLQTIAERPESFGLVRPPLRGARIQGFPYLLLFQVDSNKVLVAGLYHAYSDPSRWLDRVEVRGR